jgi:hypothetical protein
VEGANAWEGHNPTLLQQSLAGTILGRTPLRDLAGQSPEELASQINVTNPVTEPPIYDASGYDQYGYNVDGFDILGRDKNGLLDPAILSSGEFNTDTLSDGSKLTVKVSEDGAATATLDDTDGSVWQSTINADNVITATKATGPGGEVVSEASVAGWPTPFMPREKRTG